MSSNRISMSKTVRYESKVRVRSSASVDFGVSDSINTKFKVNRTNEKAEMVHLNDRFAKYISTVQFLEQQNTILSAELEQLKGKGTSRIRDVYECEMTELRQQVEKLTKDKDQFEVERDSLGDQIARLEEKLQEEMLQKEEAENNLQSYRQDVDNAYLARRNLERRVESLKKEIIFLRKVNDEELSLQDQIQQVQIDKNVVKTDLTAALKDVRQQYETLANKNMQVSEDWYKSKAVEDKDTIHQAKQEVLKYLHQVQTLTCDVEALKGTNESLERQMREVEDKYEDTIIYLEDDIRNMKENVTRHLREYQDLLNVKMTLDIEIATYRKLLDGEESRITTPMPNFYPESMEEGMSPLIDAKKKSEEEVHTQHTDSEAEYA